MCWKCDAIAVKCPNITLPDWMYRSLGPPPPHQTPSDGLSPLGLQTTAFFSDEFAQSEEHNEGSRRAPARLYATDKTGTSGPKPEIPGAIGFSGVFCL
jgi:hypothetical protein